MPQRVAQISVADNLCQLAREFKSGDQVMANAIRKEFKAKSLNDVTRAVVYLMEVIGSRDEQFKHIQKENADLRELLKLNNISLEEKNEGTASGAEGSNGVAVAGVAENPRTGELGASSTTTSAEGVQGNATQTN
jgi:hypothetical protein